MFFKFNKKILLTNLKNGLFLLVAAVLPYQGIIKLWRTNRRV